VVEKDAVGREDPVGLAVVLHDVIGVNLGGGVGALRLEGGGFALGRRGGAEHLAGRGLIESGVDSGLADRLEEPQRPQSRNIPGVLRHVEAHPHMALGAEVIDLIGLDVVQKVRELPGDSQIAVMKVDPRLGIVEVLVQMIDAVRIEGAGPTDQPVDLITLAEEKFGQIRSVLAGYAGDECLFH